MFVDGRFQIAAPAGVSFCGVTIWQTEAYLQKNVKILPSENYPLYGNSTIINYNYYACMPLRIIRASRCTLVRLLIQGHLRI